MPESAVRLTLGKFRGDGLDYLQVAAQVVTGRRPALLTRTPARTATFRLANRHLPAASLAGMFETLSTPTAPPYNQDPWPQPLITAWRRIAAGASPVHIATWLWPHYLNRVRTYLTAPGHHARLRMLSESYTAFNTAVTTDTPTSR